MVFPTSIVTTSHTSDDKMSTSTVQPQDIVSVAITTLPVTLPTYQTHRTNSGTPESEASSHESNVVITEVTDRDISEDNDFADTGSMNRTNSMPSTITKEFLSRQVSDGTHSMDSPNLPKRNQPFSSSTLIPLSKSKTEEKNEVYV